MIQIVVQSKTTGKTYDLSDMMTKLVWCTSRVGSPGGIQLTMVPHDIVYENGNIITVTKEAEGMFYGRIFKISKNSKDNIDIIAFDQMRYMANKTSYGYRNKRADEVLREIAIAYGLQLGDVENTGYAIVERKEDSKTLLDIVYTAMGITNHYTGEMHILYDDFGYLALKNIKNLVTGYVIDKNSGIGSFKHSKDIDSDTYNAIKLVKKDKEAGKTEYYTKQDNANIVKWGRLEYYETVNENTNAAQLNEKKERLFLQKNRETKTFSINDCQGGPLLRAGNSVFVQLQDVTLGAQRYLIERIEHKFEGTQHTMDLDLKVYGGNL